MDVELSARHFDLTETVRNYVDRKIGKLDRYLPQIIASRVDLARVSTRSMGEVYASQVTAWVDGAILRAEETNSDLFAAIDLSADKIHRQIERYKGKRQRRSAARMDSGAVDEEALVDEDGPRIVRRKAFDLAPMTEAEAIDQLELLGHDFFMFRHADTSQVCLLYRRRDGQLGLLESGIP